MSEDEFVKLVRSYGYSIIDRSYEIVATRPVNINTAKNPSSLSFFNGMPSKELIGFIQESQEVTKVMNEVLGR